MPLPPPASGGGSPGDEDRSGGGVAGEDVLSTVNGGTGDAVAVGGGELSHYQKFERIDGPNKVRFTAEKGSMHTKFTSMYIRKPYAKPRTLCLSHINHFCLSCDCCAIFNSFIFSNRSSKII